MVIPKTFAQKAFLRSILKIYVAMVPAYTPVPGNGMETKNISPQKPYFLILFPEPVLARLATHIAAFL